MAQVLAVAGFELEGNAYAKGTVITMSAANATWLKSRKLVEDDSTIVAAAISGGATQVTHVAVFQQEDSMTSVTDPSSGAGLGVKSAGSKAKGAAAVAAAYHSTYPRVPLPASPTRKSALAIVPVVTTAESITPTLGPTTQANSVSEWNTLKTNKREIDLSTSALFMANGKNLSTVGVVGFQDNASGQTTLVSSPWRQSNGSLWWWARGGLAFYLDGADSFAVSYILNTTNSCYAFVDGCALTGANAAGKLTNAVSSTANNRQWLALSFPDRRRRLIYLPNLANVKSFVFPYGATFTPVDFVGKMIELGDSFAGRAAGTQSDGTTPEVPLMPREIAASAAEALGYNITNAATGGTGFFADGGGRAAQKGSYSDYLDDYANAAATINGWDASSYTDVWLYGSGNDGGASPSVAKYVATIQKALATFPNLKRLSITTVYEGFNTTSAARALNDMLVAAISQVGDSRVKLIPVDSAYHVYGGSVFSGTGNTGNAANDGNADFYLSNYGSDGRHADKNGCIHAAEFYAVEMIRNGMPCSQRLMA